MLNSCLPTIAPKLKRGDHIAVIAPSRSLAAINATAQEHQSVKLAVENLKALGLQPLFGEHIDEMTHYSCASIEIRLADYEHTKRDLE